jgi:hypothetical protein
MTPARFRWGILLITFGLLFLLRNLNVLNDNFWADLIIWFPIFLIAVGIEKIFTKTKLVFISYLTSVFLFLGALLIAFSGSIGGQGSDYFSEYSYRLDPDPGIRLIKAKVDIEETDLTIRDSGDELIYAKFNKYTRKPKIDFRENGDVAIINLDSRSGSFLGGMVKVELDDSQDWYMQFSQDIPLELDCSGHKADIHLNFSTTPLRALNLTADDAVVYIKLGELEPDVRLDVKGDNSRVRLRVPGDAGLKVTGDGYDTYLERIGLEATDGVFETPAYNDFRTKIQIDLGKNLGSLSIDYF